MPKKSCPKGRVKSGPRKGRCRKVSRKRSSSSSRKGTCRYGRKKSGGCKRKPGRKKR